MLFSRNTPHSILSPSLRLVPPLFFFTNPSLPLFLHDTSPDSSPILPIPPADSSIFPLIPPPAVDPIFDQTPDLPLPASPTNSPISP
jgi:hypothetical protein